MHAQKSSTSCSVARLRIAQVTRNATPCSVPTTLQDEPSRLPIGPNAERASSHEVPDSLHQPFKPRFADDFFQEHLELFVRHGLET